MSACLTVLCHQHAPRPRDQDLTAMLDTYRQLAPAPHLAVFHTRLSLSVIDAASGVGHPGAHDITTKLIHRTVALGDGYAVRDVLAHSGCAAMLTEDQARELTEALHGCALGHQKLPTKLKADLSTALDTSETVISRALTTRVNA